MQHQLAERAEDEEREEPADGVGQHDRRTRLREAATGAEEQTGADRAADRDHLHLTRTQSLVIPLVLEVNGRGGDRLGSAAGARRSGVSHPSIIGIPTPAPVKRAVRSQSQCLRLKVSHSPNEVAAMSARAIGYPRVQSSSGMFLKFMP